MYLYQCWNWKGALFFFNCGSGCCCWCRRCFYNFINSRNWKLFWRERFSTFVNCVIDICIYVCFSKSNWSVEKSCQTQIENGDFTKLLLCVSRMYCCGIDIMALNLKKFICSNYSTFKTIFIMINLQFFFYFSYNVHTICNILTIYSVVDITILYINLISK